MNKEENKEFEICLKYIQQFFSEQGEEPLQWWYSKEEEIIDYLETHLSKNPFMGRQVETGSFIGFKKNHLWEKQTYYVELFNLLCSS